MEKLFYKGNSAFISRLNEPGMRVQTFQHKVYQHQECPLNVAELSENTRRQNCLCSILVLLFTEVPLTHGCIL